MVAITTAKQPPYCIIKKHLPPDDERLATHVHQPASNKLVYPTPYYGVSAREKYPIVAKKIYKLMAISLSALLQMR